MTKKRDIVGRKIVGVEWNYFPTGRETKPRTTDPTLILDDGTKIRFWVQETENGDYGVELIVRKAKE